MNDWYGFEKGGNGSNQYEQKGKIFPIANEPSNQADLAATYGITKHTMTNYMRLAKAIPELEDLVDTGIVTAHIKME